VLQEKFLGRHVPDGVEIAFFQFLKHIPCTIRPEHLAMARRTSFRPEINRGCKLAHRQVEIFDLPLESLEISTFEPEVMFSLRKPIFVVVEILFDVLDITAIRLGKLFRGHDSDAAVFQNLQIFHGKFLQLLR